MVENRAGDARPRLHAARPPLSITDANVILEGKLPKGAAGSWLRDRPPHLLRPGRRALRGHGPARRSTTSRAARAGSWAAAAADASPASAAARPPTRPSRTTTAASTATSSPRARNDVASPRFHAPLGARVSSDTVARLVPQHGRCSTSRAVPERRSRRSNAPGDDARSAAADVDLRPRPHRARPGAAPGLRPRSAGRHLSRPASRLHALSTAVDFVITGDRNPTEANGSSVRGGAGLPDALDSARDSTRGGAWLQDRVQATARLTLEPGLRLDWSGINRQTTLSPRLAASLRLGAATRLARRAASSPRAPATRSSSSPTTSSTSPAGPRSTSTASAPCTRCSGSSAISRRDCSLRVEGYYKRFDRLIVGRLETEAERRARVARLRLPARARSRASPREPQITSRATNGGHRPRVRLRPVRRAPRLARRAAHRLGVVHVRPRRARRLRPHATRSSTTGRHAVTSVAAWRAGQQLRRVAHRALRFRLPAHAGPRPARGGATEDRATATATATAPSSCPSATPQAGPSGRPTSAAWTNLVSRAPARVRARRPARDLQAARRRRALAVLPRRHQRAEPRQRGRHRGDPRVRPRLRPAAPGRGAGGGHPVPAVGRGALPVLNARPCEQRRCQHRLHGDAGEPAEQRSVLGQAPPPREREGQHPRRSPLSGGSTRSIRFAAVAFIRRPVHDGAAWDQVDDLGENGTRRKGGESSLAREGRKTCDKAEAVEHRQPIERSGGRHEAEMRQDRPCATDARKTR